MRYEEVVATLTRTQARCAELSTLLGILIARHGQDVGLGTYQLRIGAQECFALRATLPGAGSHEASVVITYEDGDLLLTVL